MNNQSILMYLRKSRSDDANESVEDTLARHEQILQDYSVRTFGKRIPDKYIFREVVSGETIEARPMIKQVLHLMENSEVEGVLVVDPQRLSRGDLIDCGTISNSFRYTNTVCYTPTMTYHMDIKHERKFFEGELMRGGEYLEYVKEILNRGRILSVKNGNYIGSIAPYGYKKVAIGDKKSNTHFTLEIVPEEAEAIRTMYDIYVNKHVGFAALANELDRLGYKPRKSAHWSPAALKDMIENPVYIGKLRWNWRKTTKQYENGSMVKSRPKSASEDCIIVDGLHEPIVSEEIFHAAQARKGTNICVKKKVEVRNPYSGILYCQCGRAMSYRAQEAKGIAKAQPRLICNGQTHCKTRSCVYDDFEQYVIEMLSNCIQQFQIELENSQKNNTAAIHESRKKQLKKELAEIANLEEEQYDLLESKIYTRDIFLKRHDKLIERKQAVLAALDNLEQEKIVQIDYEKKIADFSAALTALTSEGYDAAEKNYLLKQCVRRITYSRPSGDRWDNTPFSCNVTLQV